jgi:L-alanine-DL-glutamate epimerase-like enolase superfamily enzyme
LVKITALRFERVKGRWDYSGPLQEERPVRPLDVYAHYRQAGAEGMFVGPDGPPFAVEQVFLFIDTDDGVSGMYGPIRGDLVPVIRNSLAPVVVGENPHAIARIWDRMYRQCFHRGRGETITAISAVDLALWDLKGKILDLPVYELLGGPTRTSIKAYASMLGYSVKPDKVAERTRELVSQGYSAIKWFFRHGPADGRAGMSRNLELVRTAREAAGPDVDLMFDAWSSWDVLYTIEMAERMAQYRPAWIEEPVMPDMIQHYSEIKRSVRNVPISGGEHAYTRWGIKELLDTDAVDVLQPDPGWVGGLSEMVNICALASAHGKPVLPHHGGLASMHLIAAQPVTLCPMQEWLIQYGKLEQLFLKHRIEPVDGHIAVIDRPGLGLELDLDAIESREAI